MQFPFPKRSPRSLSTTSQYNLLARLLVTAKMPQKRKHPDMEFPLLKTLGLMTIKTTGGGK